MTISIEEAKSFILDCEEARRDWMVWADRSWREIKKRSENGKLWSTSVNNKRRVGKYPIWNSTLKIRQPIVFSRVPIPVGEDTTQDGTDNIGATGAVCKERLAEALLRVGDFFDVMSFSRDDFLITNFGTCRAYYSCKDIKEQVKEYITPKKDEQTGEVVFVDGSGNIVQSDNISQDDDGFYLEVNRVIDVEDERVFLEHTLYKDIYIDPDIRRWENRRRVAYAKYYSRQGFQEVFGAAALTTIPAPDPNASNSSDYKKKANTIKVFEYWDDYENEVKWWADNGTAFIKPVKAESADYDDDADEEADSETRNGLYGIPSFFPMVKPLLINQPTDDFWPVTEYYQLIDVIEDIHTIFSRMIAITKGIRARLLFDSSITGLQAALNEATDGDSFGITNLAQALSGNGGSLENAVQYIPIQTLIESLANLYTAFDQRLNTFFQLTGTADLLRGQTDNVERTYGEQQMKEKYALNQISQFQMKMQEFACDNINLMCDIALANFSDRTLAKYIVPRTLTPDHQERYDAAIGLLKKDSSRFRISLETDSTIAMNEQYNKQATIELVNALTEALEKTANIAATNPALVIPELHCLKYLVQSFRQGKLFQSELTNAIDQVIEQAQQAKPPFDVKMFEAQSQVQIEKEKLGIAQFNAQVDAYVKRGQLAVSQNSEQFDQFFDIQTLQMKAQETGAKMQVAGATLQEKWATEERLGRQEAREEAQLQFEAEQSAQGMGSSSSRGNGGAPTIIPIVIPQSQPQSGPTIINAPNPNPQTTVVQPVQTLPIL